MPALDLEILEPADGAVVVGPFPPSPALRFHGRVNPSPPPPATLFTKWYAGLEVDPIGTSLDFTLPSLSVGTQLIVFSAKDQLGDDEASLKAVVDGGFAGGERDATNPRGCGIHVAVAESIRPLAGSTLSRASTELIAVAPRKWDEPDYQRLNRVRFVWRFEPVGLPLGRPTATLPEDPSDPDDPVPLTFEASLPLAGGRPCVRYLGPLPASLANGPYRVVTRVEVFRRVGDVLVSDPGAGHEVFTDVELSS